MSKFSGIFLPCLLIDRDLLKTEGEKNTKTQAQFNPGKFSEKLPTKIKKMLKIHAKFTINSIFFEIFKQNFPKNLYFPAYQLALVARKMS